MSYGLRTTSLTVHHRVSGDKYFDKPTVKDVQLTCLVERRTSTEDLAVGVGSAANLIVVLHVKDPVTRNVDVKDTFEWHGNTYSITAVDDGIQDENMVVHTPFRWTARAEVLNGNA